jgi:two-component system NarL family response regulator
MDGDVITELVVRPQARTRTLLVDDHPLYRVGLRTLLSREPTLECVGEAGTADEALAIIGRMRIDVAVVDVMLPAVDGIELTRRLLAVQPGCKIIGLSVLDEPVRIAMMLRAGASGYVLKTQPVEQLFQAIGIVLAGIRYLPPTISERQIEMVKQPIERLTRREREILGYLLRGQTNDDIASALYISRRTVETHRQRILNKLEAHTIVELFEVASRHGLAAGD